MAPLLQPEGACGQWATLWRPKGIRFGMTRAPKTGHMTIDLACYITACRSRRTVAPQSFFPTRQQLPSANSMRSHSTTGKACATCVVVNKESSLVSLNKHTKWPRPKLLLRPPSPSFVAQSDCCVLNICALINYRSLRNVALQGFPIQYQMPAKCATHSATSDAHVVV